MYSREEIDALLRCAADHQDAAIILTAALTGLRRGELLALRWRDVDFAGQAIRVRGNLSYGQVVTPKSGKVRVVPMVDEVAQRLARLADRDLQTGDEDPVFASALGGHLDAPACAPSPSISLRHFFGSMAVNKAFARRGAGVDGTRPHPNDRSLPPSPCSAQRRSSARGRFRSASASDAATSLETVTSATD
jgi:integrase